MRIEAKLLRPWATTPSEGWASKHYRSKTFLFTIIVLPCLHRASNASIKESSLGIYQRVVSQNMPIFELILISILFSPPKIGSYAMHICQRCKQCSNITGGHSIVKLNTTCETSLLRIYHKA
jgi:hypothetical protein